MKKWIAVFLLLTGSAWAQIVVGPLQIQNSLSEIAKNGSAAQSAARLSLGLGSTPGPFLPLAGGIVTGPATFNGGLAGNLTVPSGKTATISNSLTFTGADGTSFLFPGTSDTLAGLNTAQAWTARQSFYGGENVGNGTGSPDITINGAAATNKGLNWQNTGVLRWRLVTDASDNMNLYAYDSSGAFLDTAWNATQSNHTMNFNYQIATNNQTTPVAGGVAGTLLGSHNNGINAAYGSQVQYISVAGGAGFDTGFGVIATFNPVFIGSTVHNQQGIYFVAESPNDTSHTWGGNIGEMNFVNRGPDVGFKRDRQAGGNNTGGLLFVPESVVLSGGPGEGKNVGYGFSVSRSGTVNSTGFPVKSYIAFNAEPNSTVGLTGRAFYATGDITSTASQRPYGPMQIEATWLHGIDHTLATYIDNHAQIMMAAQSLAFISGTTATPTGTATVGANDNGSGNIDLVLTPAGTGTIKAGAAAGVSCAAGTVNLTTLVVTNGLVTHC